MSNPSIFIGLDVHKDSIVVAVAKGYEKAQSIGVFPYNAKTVLRKLSSIGSLEDMLCCYEAGPMGFVLQRELTKRGLRCLVIAPSLIPKRPGDRVKTDRRDAKKLAQFLRSGELTEVYVPDEETEAIRDLERARDDAKKAQRVARQTLRAFLLRHGRRYTGKTAWTKVHLEWIGKQKFTKEAQQLVLSSYLHTVEQTTECLLNLEKNIGELSLKWHQAPLVKALQAMRGISLITAVVVVAEIGNLERFESAPELMSYLGLVPSEYSSGSKIQRGSITKTGNGHVRRVLVESAWAYRFNPRVSGILKKRQEGSSQGVLDISWKAQNRLCSRYRKLMGRGKVKQVTVTAIARELTGFIWAISREKQLLAA